MVIAKKKGIAVQFHILFEGIFEFILFLNQNVLCPNDVLFPLPWFRMDLQVNFRYYSGEYPD